jgi:hypothetical protein
VNGSDSKFVPTVAATASQTFTESLGSRHDAGKKGKFWKNKKFLLKLPEEENRLISLCKAWQDGIISLGLRLENPLQNQQA